MLLISHENFIASFQVDSVRDVAVGFGSVTEQSDLVTGASDEASQRIAKFIAGSVAPDGVIFWILLV